MIFRGKVPSELNTDLAYKIGRAFANLYKRKKSCCWYDIRKSSLELSDALD